MGLLQNTTKKATAKNARDMIIMSYPKVGKTELLTKLPGKYLILDFDPDGGTSFFDSESIQIPDLETFGELKGEFIDTKPMYDFICLDTLTSLYSNLINSIAVLAYNKEEKKSKSLDWDITKLGYGLGFIYKKEALRKVMEFFKNYCKCLITTGHVAERSMDGGGGETKTIKDLDIEGKLKNALALKTDALAMLVRGPNNENFLDFTMVAGETMNGTRIKHLRGQKILISRLDEETGVLETFWDKIFI